MELDPLSSALLQWYHTTTSQAPESAITMRDLEDGNHLCNFTRTVVLQHSRDENSSVTTMSNNFKTLRTLLHEFLTSNDFSAQQSPLSLVQQLGGLSGTTSPAARVQLGLEILLCCCVQHPAWRIREKEVKKIMSLPIESQRMLMEIIEQRLTSHDEDVAEDIAEDIAEDVEDEGCAPEEWKSVSKTRKAFVLRDRTSSVLQNRTRTSTPLSTLKRNMSMKSAWRSSSKKKFSSLSSSSPTISSARRRAHWQEQHQKQQLRRQEVHHQQDQHQQQSEQYHQHSSSSSPTSPTSPASPSAPPSLSFHSPPSASNSHYQPRQSPSDRHHHHHPPPPQQHHHQDQHQKLLTQNQSQSNIIASLQSEVDHLQHVIKIKKQTAIEMATKLDVAQLQIEDYARELAATDNYQVSM